MKYRTYQAHNFVVSSCRLARRLVFRLVRRLVLSVSFPVSPCVSSRAFRCVVSSVVPSCLFVSSARLGLSSRMGAVSFCCSLVLVSPVVAVLPCVPVPSRFRLGIPSRYCVSSIVSFSHVISSSACPLASRIRSRAWFPCSRCSVLLVARFCSPIRSRFMSSVVGRGRVVMAMGRGLLFSSHPSPHGFLFAYSLARCGMAAGG